MNPPGQNPNGATTCGNTPLQADSPPSQRVHKKIQVKVLKAVPLDTVPDWIKDIALMVFNLTRTCDDIEVAVCFDFSQLTNITRADRRAIKNYLEDEIFNLELGY